MDYSQLNDIIKSGKNILIVTHINPDGDTLGSMCGLYSAIWDNFKKKADMLVVSHVPAIYKFLPFVKQAKPLDEYDKSREYNVVINVDVAAYDRMSTATELFDRAGCSVNIDHHKTNNNYAKLNYVDSDASSTGEFLFYIMKSLGWKISEDAATCLYTALLTDTGSFRFDNTTAKTFAAASELVAFGAKPSEIYKNVYENDTKGLVLFQANAIKNAVFECDNKIVYTTVYKKDIERFSAGDDCTEGLCEKLRAISTTEAAFIVKEINSNMSKVSMRSKHIDVAEICSKFSGGGHKFAAGCVVKSSVKETIRKVLEEVKKQDL